MAVNGREIVERITSSVQKNISRLYCKPNRAQFIHWTKLYPPAHLKNVTPEDISKRSNKFTKISTRSFCMVMIF